MKIWPTLAPGSDTVENTEKWKEGRSVTNVYQPDITIFLPEHQNDLCPAVLVFPGGGYQQVVMEKEGYKIAQWLNENGIAAFVLKHRLNPKYALRDAQRAVSLIRSDAKKYNIDEHKIGKLKINESIPPAFLVHAGNDARVSVMQSVKMYSELKQKGVQAELHIYEQGK